MCAVVLKRCVYYLLSVQLPFPPSRPPSPSTSPTTAPQHGLPAAMRGTPSGPTVWRARPHRDPRHTPRPQTTGGHTVWPGVPVWFMIPLCSESQCGLSSGLGFHSRAGLWLCHGLDRARYASHFWSSAGIWGAMCKIEALGSFQGSCGERSWRGTTETIR